jgi:chorismate synthase
MQSKDTLGGLLEVVALGVPVGLGSFAQWDRRLDARLGSALLSVQAIKGVEIGEAWANASLTGTQAQDAIGLETRTASHENIDGKKGEQLLYNNSLSRTTNRAGGIEGGISNGQPIVIRAAMKPIATTLTAQSTIDLASGKPTTTRYERSDFCPVPRAVPILEAMMAFVLAEALIEKLGGDSMDEMLPRFAALRKARLDDLTMDAVSRVWWE